MRNFGGAAPARHILGNYEILEEIGRGGMGIVYRALDLSLDRIVAVKVLRDDLRTQEAIVTRFSREAKAAASLDHPNIVQIYSVGSVDRTPYIAMEYLEAVPLSVVMHRQGELDWRYAVDIADQVASALACAHERHVVHRDIKPPNILVNDRAIAHVTDFGIAKILTLDDQLTVDGSRLGTPHYMAPERCKNGDVTPSSDLYSLGVLLFQMLTGHLPFEAGSTTDLIRKITTEPAPRIRMFRHDVPESVDRLVAWLLEKNPKHRPAGGQAVCEAIARIRDGKELETRGAMENAIAEFRGALSGMETPVTTRRDGYGTVSRIRRALLRRPIVVGAVIAGLTLCALTATFSGTPSETSTAADAISDVTRWLTPTDLATFSNESPGVVLARVNLPDFRIESAAWAGSPPAAIVQLQGIDESPRQGQRAICGLRPHTRYASFDFPPIPTLHHTVYPAPPSALAFSENVPEGTPLSDRYIASLASNDANGSVSEPALYACPTDGSAHDGALRLARLAPSNPVVHGDAPRVVTAAVHPNGSTLLVTMGYVDGACYLEEWHVADDGSVTTGRRIANTGTPIGGAQYSRDGAWLAFSRASAGGTTAIWLQPASGDTPAKPVFEGPVSLSPRAFDPASDYLVFTEAQSARQPRIRAVRLADGFVLNQWGEGWTAAWNPARPMLIVTAQDRKDHTQLWAQETTPPYRREQLTFLDSGTAKECSVSEDGAWALSATASIDSPTVVFAELSDIRF